MADLRGIHRAIERRDGQRRGINRYGFRPTGERGGPSPFQHIPPCAIYVSSGTEKPGAITVVGNGESWFRGHMVSHEGGFGAEPTKAATLRKKDEV